MSAFPPLEVELVGEVWRASKPELAFLSFVYMSVLYTASNLISDGSELLLLVPSVAGLVGSIVLPILGAVPDGMMMFFSGFGPGAQAGISVGVGALAGSTVMLLTIPWVIAIIAGRVPLGENGEADYGRKAETDTTPYLQTGISYTNAIPKAAKTMLLTTMLYFIIQIPATEAEESYPTGAAAGNTHKQADSINTMSLVGLIASILAFCGYLLMCYKEANCDKQLEAIIAGIKARNVSLATAMKFLKKEEQKGSPLNAPLKTDPRLRVMMRPFFTRFDCSGNGKLDSAEFRFCMKELGQTISEVEVSQYFKKYSGANNDQIPFDTFCKFVQEYMAQDEKNTRIMSARVASIPAYDMEDEEEEEMPEDLANLPEDQQQLRIILRSLYKMGCGTFLVLVFSDPMVDVLGAWGVELGIPAFYISFVLAPFASNASELIAAANYASKKTQKAMTTSLSTLVGAACMNNTFCLAIFYALIWTQDLAWQFTAETISIVVIQWMIGFVAITKTTHTVCTGFLIIMCYPLCLLIVAVLESPMIGLD